MTSLQGGAGSSNPSDFVEYNGYLYFTAQALNGNSNRPLYRTDGTNTATLFTGNILIPLQEVHDLLVFNNRLYLVGISSTWGNEVYYINSDNNMVLLKDIRVGNNGSLPSSLTIHNNKLYFIANDGVNGNELWTSDGTDAGTIMISNINPGGGHAFPYNPPTEMVSSGNFLYFPANNGTNGVELWRTDGTPAGTIMPLDINPGSAGSNPQYLTAYINRIYFSATEPIRGREFWSSNGFSNSTLYIEDIWSGVGGSAPQDFHVFNDTLYFSAHQPISGRELWKSGGSFSNTVLDTNISQANWSSDPVNFYSDNNNLYFSARNTFNGPRHLWKKNAGTGITEIIKNNVTASHFTHFDCDLHFSYDSLWKTDGTSVGTNGVAGTGGSLSPQHLTTFNGALFFSGDNGTAGRELWRYGDMLQTPQVQIVDNITQSTSLTAQCEGDSLLLSTNILPGYNYNWSSSPDGLTWNTIPNANAATFRYRHLTNIQQNLFFKASANNGGSCPIEGISSQVAVHATDSIRLKVRVTEVCGYGEPDGVGLGQEYRWQLAVNDQQGNTQGLLFGRNNALQGCYTAANNNGFLLGFTLPKIEFDQGYSSNHPTNIILHGEGWEKNCFPGNSCNGTDFNYRGDDANRIDCGCPVTCWNCNGSRGDADLRLDTIIENVVSLGRVGEWQNINNGNRININRNNTKYAFRAQYLWTPPKVQLSQIEITGVQDTVRSLFCQGEPIYIRIRNYVADHSDVEYYWQYHIVGDDANCGGQNSPIWRRFNVTDDTSRFNATPALNLSNGDAVQFRVTAVNVNTAEVSGVSAPTPSVYIVGINPSGYTLSTQNVLCRGDATGSISVSNIQGGQPSFRVAMRENVSPFTTVTYPNVPAMANTVFNNLSASQYAITIESNNGNGGCLLRDTVNITEPATNVQINSLIPSNYNGFEISCFGGSDGIITVNSSGGTGSHEYSIQGNNYQTSNVFGGLSVGTYSIQVRDANNCITSVSTVTLDEPTDLTTIISSNNNYSGYSIPCFGGTGQVDVTVSGGVPPYTVTVNGTSIIGSITSFSNLPAGTYNVNVIDDNSCVLNSSVTLTQPPDIVSFITDTIPPKCIGGCDGALRIADTGGVPFPGNFYHYYIDSGGVNIDSFFGDTAYFTNLSAVTYRLRVEDSHGCVDTINFTLPDRPDPLRLDTMAILLPTCHDWSDGSIQVRGLDGNPPYSFSVDHNITYNPDSLVSFTHLNLHGDSAYVFHIRDSEWSPAKPNICMVTDTIFLADIPKIDAIFTVEDALCFQDTNGNIYTSVSGGNGDTTNFTLNWRDSTSTAIIDTNKHLLNYPSGKYNLTIYDERNCQWVSGDIEIGEPSLLEISGITVDPTTCAGRTDGRATIQASGGNLANYFYALDNGPFVQNNGIFNNLATGWHHIEVQDSNYCTVIDSFFVDSTIITIQFAIDSITAYGANDGAIDSLSSTGSPLHTFYLGNNGTWITQPPNLFNNLSPGVYQLVSEDATNCLSDTIVVTLLQPDSLVVVAQLQQDAACGLPLGMATAQVFGGAAPYSIDWLDVNRQYVNPDSLFSGKHYVRVRDANGTETIDSLIVGSLPGLTLNTSVTQIPTCNLPLGEIEVTIFANGIAPYTYLWDDVSQQTTPIATQLTQGTYHVDVTDSRGCVETATILLADGPALIASKIDSALATCNTANGVVEIAASGGIAPYQYQWNTPLTGTNPRITGLAAGIYNATITDAVGCQITYGVTVDNQGAPAIAVNSVTQPFCDLPNGQISTVASGGTNPYTYQWFDQQGQSIAQTSNTAINLVEGTYWVQVTDGANCISTSQITLTNDTTQEPTIYLVSSDSAACGMPLGNATVGMTGGMPGYTYQWQVPLTAVSNTVNNLLAGSYEVIGTDANGCVQTLQVIVEDKQAPVLHYNFATTAHCGLPLGQAGVLASRGNPPYQYQWNDPTQQSTPIASNLTAGIYNVFARDADNCMTQTLQIEIEDEPLMQLQLSSITPVSCYDGQDGSATIMVSNGGIAPYQYLWDNGDTSISTNMLTRGMHQVMVTDSIGCTDSLFFTIQAPLPLEIVQLLIDEPNCFGYCDGSIQASAIGGTGNISYTWSNGQFGLTDTALCTGNYTLTLVDANICLLDTTIFVDEPPLITTTGIPRDDIICTGEIITLDPGNQWASTQWTSTNGFSSNNAVIAVTDSGHYFLTVISDSGCIVNDTFSLTVSSDLLAADFVMPSEGLAGESLIAIDISDPSPDSTFWVFNDSLVVYEGEITPLAHSFYFPYPGEFSIKMQVKRANCFDEREKTVTIYADQAQRDTGVRPGSNVDHILEVIIYPNPNSGTFKVEVLMDQIQPLTIRLYGVLSNLPVAEQSAQGLDEYEMNFDLPTLVPGVYLLRLESNGTVKTFRFVVN